MAGRGVRHRLPRRTLAGAAQDLERRESVRAGQTAGRARRVSGAGLPELAASAEFLRTLEHFVRLVTGHPGKQIPAAEHARACIANLVSESLAGEPDRVVEGGVGRGPAPYTGDLSGPHVLIEAHPWLVIP